MFVHVSVQTKSRQLVDQINTNFRGNICGSQEYFAKYYLATTFLWVSDQKKKDKNKMDLEVGVVGSSQHAPPPGVFFFFFSIKINFPCFPFPFLLCPLVALQQQQQQLFLHLLAAAPF